MKTILKHQSVYSLPPTGTLDLLVQAHSEVWIEDRTGTDSPRQIEVHLEAGARVHFMSAFSSNDTKLFRLDESARLEYFHHAFGSSSDSLKVILEGEESSVFSQTLFFGKNEEKQNLRVDHVHLGKRTRSEMISRGAVQNKAYSHFFGNILMEQGCTGADGRLEEHNLLLSSGAKIEAVPGLEIRHNEVQASHSATLERVDNEKIFYLESRGLPLKEGMELLVEGFFWDALQKCPDLAYSEFLFKHIVQCLSK